MTYPAGVTVRPLRLHGSDGPDVDAAFAVTAAAETAVLGEPDGTREETRAFLAGSAIDLERSRLVLDRERPIGLLVVEVDVPAAEVLIDPYAHSGAPAGLWRALVGDGLQQAEEVAREHPDAGPWHVEAGAFVGDTAYRDALADLGFEPSRRFWRMRIDLADSGITGDPVPAPPGVDLVRAASPDEIRALHAVHTEAFTEHWGEVPRDYDAWLQRRLDRSGGDQSQWWLARLDGRPAGLLLGDKAKEELGESFVGVVGVAPWARGQGIGEWLLRMAFADAAARGMRAVTLNVDSENSTGATRLYERAGMHPTRIIDAWRRPLGR